MPSNLRALWEKATSSLYKHAYDAKQASLADTAAGTGLEVNNLSDQYAVGFKNKLDNRNIVEKTYYTDAARNMYITKVLNFVDSKYHKYNPDSDYYNAGDAGVEGKNDS